MCNFRCCLGTGEKPRKLTLRPRSCALRFALWQQLVSRCASAWLVVADGPQRRVATQKADGELLRLGRQLAWCQVQLSQDGSMRYYLPCSCCSAKPCAMQHGTQMCVCLDGSATCMRILPIRCISLMVARLPLQQQQISLCFLQRLSAENPAIIQGPQPAAGHRSAGQARSAPASDRRIR